MLIRVDLPAPFSPTMPVMRALVDGQRHAAHGVHAAERLVDRSSSIAGTPATSGTGHLQALLLM